MKKHQELSDKTISIADKLTWTDPQIAEYHAHAAHCAEQVEAIRTSRTAAARYARAQFKASLEATQARLDAVPSIEAERAAALAAVEALRAHNAKPPATTVDDELRRGAERTLLARAADTAFATYLAAAQASKLPAINWPRHMQLVAEAETAELVHALAATPLSQFELGYVHRSSEKASILGRSMHEHTPLYIAQAERIDRGPAQALRAAEIPRADLDYLFAVRWSIAARVLRLPAEYQIELPDMPSQAEHEAAE